MPFNSLICRWGGDEFTAMITGMTGDTMDEQAARLHTAADLYNAVCADSQMYLDKQKWYALQGSRR